MIEAKLNFRPKAFCLFQGWVFCLLVIVHIRVAPSTIDDDK